MHNRSYSLLLVIAIFCSGCSVTGMTCTTTMGDSVANQGGLGSGTVAGVNIRVLELKQKNAAVTHSVETVQGPENTSQHDRWEVEFGEVKLVLECSNDQPISLTIDGLDYGTVARGDDLLIDADRKVTVNGKERMAQ